MSPRLPTLRSRQVLQALQKAGFVREHQTGSHIIVRHPETGRKVALPWHNRDLKRGTMMGIIEQAGLTPGEFAEFLHN